VADVTCHEQGADPAGRDGCAAEAARGVDGDAEAEFAAQCLKPVGARLGMVAEAEVFALVHLGCVMPLTRMSWANWRGCMWRSASVNGEPGLR